MAMNHEPRQIDSLFSTSDEPWITRNFSLIGGMSDDYNILLDRVFKDGKVKHIIFDFDYFSFARQQNVITDYLYTDNFFDKFKYIFNYTTLENCVRKYKNPVRVDNLYHFYAPNNRKELFNNYKKVKDEVFSDDGYNFDFSVMKSHFDKHLLRYIQKRSDIDWYIYFPPYSIFEFIRYRDGGHMAAISQFKKYVIEELLKQPNVNTYDFQPEVSWIMNFNEYTDVRHHSHAFNHAIIISLSRDEYLVTQDNYLDKIDSLNRIIKSVNADKLMKTHKKQ